MVGNLFGRIKDSASGRWSEILPALTQLTGSELKKKGEDHPCPLCGGESVIYPATDAEKSGSIVCRNCTDGRATGDGIATVRKWAGLQTQGDAAKAIAQHLGIEWVDEPAKPRDIIADVCLDKRMPIDAFIKFGASVAKRGKSDVARVPVYNGRGEAHSYFDLGKTGKLKKGLLKEGQGSSGLFLPGKLPQPGETWHIVEGCKDAAALVGLGYDAAGLPTCEMNVMYAQIFAGVHVVFVPDLDVAGQDGAQLSGGRLSGIAASVRIARLPGEVREKDGDDVRDVLSRTGGEQMVRDAIAGAVEWSPKTVDELAGKLGEKPEVIVTLNEGHVASEVVHHLGKLGWDSDWLPERVRESVKVYVHGGSLAQAFESEDPSTIGLLQIRPLPIAIVRERITQACNLVVIKEQDGEDKKVGTRPGKWLVDAIHQRGVYDGLISPLVGVIQSPTLRPDGSILQTPGYDRETGLLYKPNESYPLASEQPSQDDAKAAFNSLLEVVADFPFLDNSDRAGWVCLVLTMIGRASIAGCCPLFGITATCPGSGKGLLADAAAGIAYGHQVSKKEMPKDDVELGKLITTLLYEGQPCHIFDNLDRPLRGASLDAVLTTNRWKDRLLGFTKSTGELPARCIWIATGNNLVYGSDTARRVLPIRLRPKDEEPEKRTGFVHKDLLSWIANNRAKLVVDCLTILRAFCVAGQTTDDKVWGSYEDWVRVVRGAVIFAGGADPLGSRVDATANDDSKELIRRIFAGFGEVDPDGQGVTIRDIGVKVYKDLQKNHSMREVIEEICRGPLNPKRFAAKLRAIEGRVVDGIMLEKQNAGGGVMRWRVGSVGSVGSVQPISHMENSKQSVTPMSESNIGNRPNRTHQSHQTNPSTTKHKCDCGECLLPAEREIKGWRNWDCPSCKAVKPIREGLAQVAS